MNILNLEEPIPFQAPPDPSLPSAPVDLVQPLPSLSALIDQEEATRAQSADCRLRWARQVFRFVFCTERLSGHDESVEPPGFVLEDPSLKQLVDQSISFIRALSQTTSLANDELSSAEALYVLADLTASGCHPEFCHQNASSSLRMFEKSALMGWAPAWFRLGLHHEGAGDAKRANDCFRRGVQGEDQSCLYRMGMAYLLGQLGRSIDYSRAIGLVSKAADVADEDFPAPSYVFGMLLAGEFDLPETLDTSSLERLLDQVAGTTGEDGSPSIARLDLAITYLEKAASLNFPAAQYKLGHCYEHALLGCRYDPLLSVQWYLLSSENGEPEADMALSKWFLAGEPGHLPIRPELSHAFAEKAARKGLPDALFALGYYYEVGIGKPKDLAQARKWYKRAARAHQGDAKLRLAALSDSTSVPFSMQEHHHNLDEKLVRKRTNAIRQSEANELVRSESSIHRRPSTSSWIHPGQITSDPHRAYHTHPSYDHLFDDVPPTYPRHALPLDPDQKRYHLQELFVDRPELGGQPRYSRRSRVDDSRQQGTRYQSFHQMGFVPVKAEDKDCVIM